MTDASSPMNSDSFDHRLEFADEPVFVFTRTQIQALDRAAVDEFHVPTIVLMENAARSAAEEILRALADPWEQRILILCGSGNNGGDGLAIARHLSNAGCEIVIGLAFDRDTARPKLSEATGANLRICEAMGLPIVALHDVSASNEVAPRIEAAMSSPSVVIDALLGTGSSGPPRSPADHLIDWMNEIDVTRIAIDAPSGLDCETGQAPGACVRADLTVTLVGLKVGFLELDAQPYLGEIAIGDIGAPVELLARFGEVLETEPHPEEPAGPSHPAAPDVDEIETHRPPHRR